MQITKETSKEKLIELASDCKACGTCCKMGSGFLAEDDLSNIANFLEKGEEMVKKSYMDEVLIFGTTLLRPKIIGKEGRSYGPCIFLENDKCVIHEVKPLGCKIATCKEHGKDSMEWFYLNYAVKPYDPHSISEWEARLKSHPTIQGGRPEQL